MTGAVDALGLGSATFNRNEVIIAACQTFADLSGRTWSDMPGVALSDLVQPADRPAGRWLLSQFWRDNSPVTFLARSRRPDGEDFLAESRVMLLAGSDGQTGLVLSRRFNCRERGPEMDKKMAQSRASYIVDMAQQMASMAALASMPVTCDLLDVVAQTGLRESGLDHVEETPA